MIIVNRIPKPCAACRHMVERDEGRGYINGQRVHAHCLPGEYPAAEVGAVETYRRPPAVPIFRTSRRAA